MYSIVMDPPLKTPRDIAIPLIDGSQALQRLGYVEQATIRLYWITTLELQSLITDIQLGRFYLLTGEQEGERSDQELWDEWMGPHWEDPNRRWVYSDNKGNPDFILDSEDPGKTYWYDEETGQYKYWDIDGWHYVDKYSIGYFAEEGEGGQGGTSTDASGYAISDIQRSPVHENVPDLYTAVITLSRYVKL